MAEIHVQAKKPKANNTWVWIVLLLIVAAAVIYFLTRDNSTTEQDRTVTPNTPTSCIELEPEVVRA